MALKNYSNAWKNCATCACWRGERKVSEDKTASVVNNSATGTCEGFWAGSRKYPNDKCDQWEKWPELRDWDGEVHRTYP